MTCFPVDKITQYCPSGAADTVVETIESYFSITQPLLVSPSSKFYGTSLEYQSWFDLEITGSYNVVYHVNLLTDDFSECTHTQFKANLFTPFEFERSATGNFYVFRLTSSNRQFPRMVLIYGLVDTYFSDDDEDTADVNIRFDVDPFLRNYDKVEYLKFYESNLRQGMNYTYKLTYPCFGRTYITPLTMFDPGTLAYGTSVKGNSFSYRLISLSYFA